MTTAAASINAKLARFALARQGLLAAAPFGRGKSGTLKAIKHIGYAQIDTISVVARAHHHVLATRVPNYQPMHLEQLVRDKQIFEYWHHAAAYLPMADYRFARLRMQDIKQGVRFWSKRRDLAVEAQVMAQITAEGPQMARDFVAPSRTNSGWWEWKPAKHALEQLFMQGDLCVVGRQGFQKVYDLPERALPSSVITKAPTVSEYAQHLLDSQLQHFGCVTPKWVTYLQRFPALRTATADLFKARVHSQRLIPVAQPNGSALYVDPELLELRLPSAARRVNILSPFDNCIIQRERTQHLFNFDYQIECYVPAAKRQYGYFCLPLVFADQFIGRMDCKAHRQSGLLEIKTLYLDVDADDVLQAALIDACVRFAKFNGCNRLKLSQCRPQRWQKALRQAFDNISI